MYRRSFLTLATSAVVLGIGRSAWAGRSPVFSEHGIAIRGADPVAYFRGEGAVAGRATESVMWHGAVWLFARPANREAFERDPRHFSPRFGGYCAYTLSQGSLASIDPRAYAVVDERLYLLHSLEIRDVWRKNMIRNIELAKGNWPEALD